MTQNNNALGTLPHSKTATFPAFPPSPTSDRLAVLLKNIPAREKPVIKEQPALAPPERPARQETRALRDIASELRAFIVSDTAALFLALLASWALAAAINTFSLDRNVLNGFTRASLSQILHVFAIGPCLILWFAHTGHYHVRMPFWMETKKIVEAAGFAMLIDAFLSFASKYDFSRLWLVSNWIFAAFGLILLRTLWRHILRRRGQWQIATLLIGNGSTAEDARVAIDSEPSLGYQVVAQVKDLPQAFESAGWSWQALCATHKADYVVIALDGPDIMDAGQPLAQLMREAVPFSVSPPLQNLPVLGMVPQYFFNHDVMLLTRSNGLDQPLQRFFKRSFDIVAATMGLLAFSPILLILALVVKFDGGPALYRHKRLGINGKTFRCLKFRSMVTNGDAVLRRCLAENPRAQNEWKRTYKLRDDPRVTAVGAFLRRTSLDELPQLINVLRGDMSIVGPRPIIVAETKEYEHDISHYFRVRPGITGLWQVSGRNDVTYHQRVQMDSWYVRNWSLWHDIAIICKTVPVVVRRNGAY